MKTSTFSGYIIYVISNESWGKMMFSKHHYALELAKNNTVFFVNPSPPWNLRNLFNQRPVVSKVQKDLFIVTYKNLFPQAMFKRLFIKLNDKINSKKLLKLGKKDKKTIFWQFDPFRFLEYPRKNVNLFRIYHVVDPYYSVFGNKYLAKNSNLIIIVNEQFRELYLKHHKPLIYIPHGFHKLEIIKDLNFKNPFPKPYILMAGTVAEDIDFDCIENIIKVIKKECLLIIGENKLTNPESKRRFNNILKNKNVIYHPAIPMFEIEQIALGAEVGLISYVKPLNPFHVRTPLKAVLYLLANKPILTSYPLKPYLDDEFWVLINENDIMRFKHIKIDKIKNAKYIINNTYAQHLEKIYTLFNATTNK